MFDYKLCQSSITRTDSIKDLGVITDSKLHFRNHVDYILSQCINFLGLVRNIIFTFASTDVLYIIYFTLIMSKLEYACVVCTSIMATEAIKTGTHPAEVPSTLL
jgi:hypothetical protein